MRAVAFDRRRRARSSASMGSHLRRDECSIPGVVHAQAAPMLRLGRLPGDFSWNSGNVRVFVPIGTSILLSVLLTVLLNAFTRLSGR